MTTVNTTKPTTGTAIAGNIPRYSHPAAVHRDRLALSAPPSIEAALRSILNEVTPGERPYSGDSYLPAHLVEAAQAAIDGDNLAAHQHAYNALSTAAWHIARGEAPQALARLRRAQSHITASMEGAAS